MAKVIAIVEDDLDQRENYADVLSSHGYEVRCYADKADAEEGFRTACINAASSKLPETSKD